MEVEMNYELYRNVRLFGFSLIGADAMFIELTKTRLDEYADNCVEVFGYPAISTYYDLSFALGKISPALRHVVERHAKEVSKYGKFSSSILCSD